MAKRNNWLKNADTNLIHVLRFFIKFNLFAIPLYIILYEGWTLVELQLLVANAVTAMLQSIGFNPTAHDLLISIPIRNGNWGAFINWDCTGWKSMLAFFALVMATEFPLRRKLAGLLLIPVIFVINLLRIVFMFFYVRTFDLANYQIVHAVIWSWGLIAVIIVLWLLWLRFDFTKCWKRKDKKRRKFVRKRVKAKRKSRKR
ncbi:MAG TPA: exosortase/archaeosortase family protein [Candidatus Aenigmarchaeota archaeon]|nr:exosortase/archaeosortase family protein [Candidatus Aenigmarchaeota archaeon]